MDKERKNFILISKDALCKDYLHIYGKKAYQVATPNIDELVAKGTLFNNYYCAAGSTVMAFYSMCTGQFAHETDFQMYERIHFQYKGETIFTKAKKIGFDKCHIVWDVDWGFLPEYFDYFRNDVTIHNIDGFRERVSFHKKIEGAVKNNDKIAMDTLEMIRQKLQSLLETDESVFIWLHLPHVVRGRAGYGSDIDMFDKYVGMVRTLVSDECIAITADHGNLNGNHGKLAYGFDVYNKVANIPLILPRKKGLSVYNGNVSSVDLFSLLFENEIPHRNFVYCDSAYRAQKSRKLAIVYKDYKYIYTKKNGNEELYNLTLDPEESFSLMSDKWFDVDRKVFVNISEELYFPRMDELANIRKKMREERKRIWRNGTFKVVVKSNIKDKLRPIKDWYMRQKKDW